MRRISALVLFGCAGLFAGEVCGEKAVLRVVQRLLDAMAARDEASLRALMIPEGRYFAVRPDHSIASGTHAEFIARVAASKEALLERMWDPKVLIRGGIAPVWAAYDFHRNKKFTLTPWSPAAVSRAGSALRGIERNCL